MHLPPLSSPVVSGYYSSGDVSIAGDVVMAAGVILQANPGCYIRLEPGVCLGLGVILHASEGHIVVRSNAILGAGVLVVGWAEIGSQACLGSSVTVFKATIAAGEMVAPGSLLGQRGRLPTPDGEPVPQVPGSFSLGQHFSWGHQGSRSTSMEEHPVEELRPQDSIPEPPAPTPSYPANPEPIAPPPDPYPPASCFSESSSSETPIPDTPAASKTPAPPSAVPESPEVDPTPAIEEEPPVQEPWAQAPSSPPSPPMEKGQPGKVYGKDYFLQMRFAMFPHRSDPGSGDPGEFTD